MLKTKQELTHFSYIKKKIKIITTVINELKDKSLM